MKYFLLSPVALSLVLTGCSSTRNASKPASQPIAAQPTTSPVRLTATQELAKYCRVCVVDKGEKMEEFLPSRLTTTVSGQTYKFCSEPCRKKFDSNHKTYLLLSNKAK